MLFLPFKLQCVLIPKIAIPRPLHNHLRPGQSHIGVEARSCSSSFSACKWGWHSIRLCRIIPTWSSSRLLSSPSGVRIIYYFKKQLDEIWMLTIYSKHEVANIPAHILRQIAEEIKDV